MRPCCDEGRARLKAWSAVAAWCLLIFLLSSAPGTGASPRMDWAEILLRKAAHGVEYAVLFLLSRRAFLAHGDGGPVLPPRAAGAAAFLFCVLYAVSDEWHQTFVPGREGCARDVAIDALGATLAWTATRAVGRRAAVESGRPS